MAKYNSLDDLPSAEYKKVERAITRFRKNKTRDAEYVLYEVLTNAGLSDEYADEFVNMELDDN